MSENLIIFISAIYATIITVSYKKAGFFAALFWPITIIIAGAMVYLTIMFTPDVDDN